MRELTEPTKDFTPKFLDELREMFFKDFYWACVAVLESPFPSSMLYQPVHQPLCEFISDPKNTRAGVILPRDWLKSTVCSVYYPTWRAMSNENFTSLLVQNTFTNATKKLTAIRGLLYRNKLLRALFPHRMPDSTCQVSAEAICLPRSAPLADATFQAAGVGTDVTGRHVNLIDEDDTVSPEQAHMTADIYEPSQLQVEQAIGFHKSLHFLLQDLRVDQRIVVGTRWRERDLFTHIIENNPEYKFMVRAVRELDGVPSSKGEIVWPGRFGEDVLKSIYYTVGDYMYNALMMSTPLASKDCFFHESDLQVYSTPPEGLLKYTTVDPAPPESRGLDPDYNVVLTTGIHPTSGRVYVLDYWRARGTPKEVIDAIFDHVNRFNPLKVGIESVGYQQTLSWWTREMQVKQKKYFIVEDLKSGGRSKPARIKGLQPVVAAHGLYLLPWMDELRQEFVAYPRGAHDDVIDALAYQLSFWQHTVALEQEQRELEADKRTGAKLLAELHDRFRRPQTYPYDMLGRSESGALVADVSEETHGEHFQYTHYFGGLFSGPSYRN